MKINWFTRSVLAIMLVVITQISCSRFPTQFGYVGDEKLQTIAFVFSPYAEGAPGDTIHLTAVFAGEPIQSYACSLSTSFARTQYGQDTAWNFQPLNDVNATVSADSITLSFAIPPDFFAHNTLMMEQIRVLVPDSVKNMLPVSIDSMSPAEFASFLHVFLAADFAGVDSATQIFAATIAKTISGIIELHMNINGGYTIQRQLTVRYNSHMTNNPYIYPNTNPDPFWIGVYKTKNNLNRLYFTPARVTEADTLLCLYLKPGVDSLALAGQVRFTDTVLIDTGYTYYLAADSGKICYVNTNGDTIRDTSLDKSITYSGLLDYEIFNYVWFYRVDSAQGVDPARSLIIQNGTRDYFTPLAPSLDGAVINVTAWLRISDSFTNELFRPIAASLWQVHMVFKYTQPYLDAAAKQ